MFRIFWELADYTDDDSLMKLIRFKLTSKDPKICEGRIIIPFDIDSATGKVSSTANESPMGMMGMTVKPTKTRLIAKRVVLPDGSVKKDRAMNRIAPKDVPVIMSLYLEVLSKAMPRTKEPATPEKMKMPPKMAFSTPWKP